MRVLLAAGPLDGLSAAEVRSIAARAWQQARPEDDVVARIVSDGRPVRGASSALEEVIGGAAVERAGDARLRTARAHIWRTDSQVLLDYTSVLAADRGRRIVDGPGNCHPDAEGSARSHSSEIIGEDLRWAASEAIAHAVIALPGPSRAADLGFGILEGLGQRLPGLRALVEGDLSGALEMPELAKALGNARQALGTLRMTVLAADEQRLTGLHGLARSSMMRASLAGRRTGGDALAESMRAQRRDAQIGQIVDQLAEAADSSGAGKAIARLLGTGPDPRGSYAGAGGGAAFMLQCLGARLYPVGDVTVRSRLEGDIAEAELLVYIASTVEADLPSGLLAACEMAGEAIPVVLICDRGGFEAGELRHLPIAGAYELRPHLAFMPEDAEGAVDAGELAALLAERTRAVARTWAY